MLKGMYSEVHWFKVQRKERCRGKLVFRLKIETFKETWMAIGVHLYAGHSPKTKYFKIG